MKLRNTMRNLLTAMFAMVFVLGAGVEASNAQYTGTGTFNKITSVEDLTDGYYVITNETDAFTMTNGRSGSATTGFFVSAAISPVSGTILNPATDRVWKIEVNGDGRTIYNEDISKYVGYVSGNSASIEDEPANSNRWTFTYESLKFTVLNVASSTRQLSYNSDAPRFAAYGNDGQQKLQLYKLDESAPATSLITPSTLNIEGLMYSFENGPSGSELFTITGSNLDPENAEITITAPTSFEVSTDNITFSNSVNVTAEGGSISETEIYTRLISGLAISDYSGNITISGGDASSVNIAVSGRVTEIVFLLYDFVGNSSEAIQKPQNATTSDFLVSSGSITYGTTGTWAGSGTPYAQSGSGWGITNKDDAKYFHFTIDPDLGYGFNLTNISFEWRTTGAGPSAVTVEVNGTEVATFNSGSNAQAIFDEALSLNNQSTLEVKIKGWNNGSRSTSGGGDFRINDVRIDGQLVDDIYFKTITGAAGWRMLSAPVQNMTISVFDGKAGIQGFDNDGFIRNLYTGYDGTTWTPSGDNSTAKPTTFESGRGIMLYLYDNNQAGSTPIGSGLEITASGVSPSEDVVVSVHQDGDHKINFLGNPFSEPILVSELTGNGDFLANVLVYDHSTNGFISSSDEIALDGKIAPWQGFILGNIDATSITIPTSAKTTGGNFLKENRNWSQLQFILSSVDGENVQIRDRSIIVQLREEEELDRFELPKMSPMSQPSAMMYFADNTQEQTRIMGQVARSNEIPNRVEIPFDVVSYNAGERFRIEWPLLRDIPEDIEFFILDTLTGEEIPLTDGTYFDFVIDATEMAKSDGLIAEADVASSSTRFKLVGENARTTSLENADQMPSEVALAQNFPNPFNPTTRISYQLPAESQVRLAVYDLLGRQVAVLVNDRMAPGSHFVNFNAESLSSGVYIYRLEASGVVLTQKMTLVK